MIMMKLINSDDNIVCIEVLHYIFFMINIKYAV